MGSWALHKTNLVDLNAGCLAGNDGRVVESTEQDCIASVRGCKVVLFFGIWRECGLEGDCAYWRGVIAENGISTRTMDIFVWGFDLPRESTWHHGQSGATVIGHDEHLRGTCKEH